jgi:carboxynorspermidine decarboxylase
LAHDRAGSDPTRLDRQLGFEVLLKKSSRQRADWISEVETPAFVIDERRLERGLKIAVRLRDTCGFKLLYALKPLTFEFVLELMMGSVDGFATSSLFEARMARAAIGAHGSVHVTTPGFRAQEIGELSQLCDAVTFNSLPQWRRFASEIDRDSQVGLRVNPGLSFVGDPRYDPCRRHSKLGVDIDRLAAKWRKHPALFDRLRGLLVHTNCDSPSFEPLYRTVLQLDEKLGSLLSHIQWINLGGGYLFRPGERADLLADAVRLLQSRHGLDVYLEPGASLVRQAGFLVASVIDRFRSGGKSIAVLDTTVNHMPEMFEYQCEPDVIGHDDDADHEYQLVGSSCLAGDIMGDYGFHRPLFVGSRVVFTNIGAYAMVKAHMFNGINLPTVYSVMPAGELVLRRRFTYEDFLSRFGACRDAAV